MATRVTDDMVLTFKAAWERANIDGRNERSRYALQEVFDAFSLVEAAEPDPEIETM